MTLKVIAAVAAATVAFASLQTQAQVVSPTIIGTNYLAIVGDNSQGGSCTTGAGPCISAGRGIPLSYYATSSDVASNFAAVNGQLTAVNGLLTTQSAAINSLNASVASLNNQVTQTMTQLNLTNAQVNRVFDGAAMGIAMKDAIPNYGDRFAVRVNMGGFDSHVGGSISFAANVSDQIRLNLDFGQSRLQSAVSGGLNFSFN